jgi:peroxiredoxin
MTKLIRKLFALCAATASLALASSAFAAGNPGESAADFPPGAFSDQGRYSLKDFEGKAVVLFFYEQGCPTCRGKIPDRNAVVEAFKDKPVKFIAVAPEDSLMEASLFVKETKLQMPAFADTLGLMQARYGQKISLNNIYQFRVIGPDGKIRGMSMEQDAIERALEDVTWKYKEDGQNPKVARAVEMLEWNQFGAGMAALRPLLKAKATAEQAQKVYDKVKVEAAKWAEDAAQATESDPSTAYDLYTRVVTCVPDEEVGKHAKDALGKLKTNKTVVAELAARKEFAKLDPAFAKANVKQKTEIARFCQTIAKKYKETPTGAKAQALADELAS